MTDRIAEEIARPAPDGWALQPHMETFSGRAGPYYFREEGARPGVGFFAEPRHANVGNVVHGGALMTLADMALFDTFFRSVGRKRAVTATLNAEFLAPAPIGVFVEASGEVVRAGKTLVFVRGLVSADGKDVLAFSGSLKRLS